MAVRPSVPEIITVNSEDLQTQIRDLLPSQNGFGSELQATNVITPIIDLTATAEGSSLPTYLQTALAFGSQTTFLITNATDTSIASSAGFYRVYGISTVDGAGVGTNFELDDGSTQKRFWNLIAGTTATELTSSFDFTVFLRPGDSLVGSASPNCFLQGSVRQVATGDGTLVQPNGYPL
jgi:hypothetical protein